MPKQYTITPLSELPLKSNVEVIEVTDEYDVAFGETGKVRPLGQLIAVDKGALPHAEAIYHYPTQRTFIEI